MLLSIASAGWVLDVFEEQVFNSTRGQMLNHLLGASAESAAAKQAGDLFPAVSQLGEIVFHTVADRIGCFS